jgi:NitT/TauT family transport system ATP-binding protein
MNGRGSIEAVNEGTARSQVTARSVNSHVEDRPIKIECEGVERVFGVGSDAVRALGPVDLSISAGEFVCLVGPSGCGKSTLIRVIAGLLEPSNGRVSIHLDGSSPTPIATVFQDFGIFPWKTVEANVRFGLVTRAVGRAQAAARAADWIERLGLTEFRKAYPATLSGGMRQRVAIARALAVEPEILLMDEPFASLDAQLREILQEELLAICQAEARTVVFVTHSLEEALVLGDRVLVMTARPGRVLDETVVPFERPRHSRVRESPEFGALRVQLWDHLRSEVDIQRHRPQEVKP